MDDQNAFAAAFALMLRLDPAFVGIVGLSVRLVLSSVFISAAIGLPLGAALALARFPGRDATIVVFNTLMGFPPVVAGLIVYLLLSHSGPFGFLDLLFTLPGMIIAQTVLITPIVVSLTRQVIQDLWVEYAEQLRSLGSSTLRAIPTLLWDSRFSLITTILAGFGRASAEVGAVLIVGGNIEHVTRTMTTAIALETSKGNLPLAVGLGLVLIALVVVVNALAWGARRAGERY
ncbi:MAG TPA: ABC transporter permease, partial [Alphaproteobacteria bacterium]|nr:ABC transporter permease [Alphaproteobacteria bacterium]